ncbi:MAG: radical SAM protein [bacterium]
MKVVNNRQSDEYKVWQDLIDKAHNNLIPLMVVLELTYRCNLRCIHCYIESCSSKDELTLGEIDILLEQLKDAGTMLLILTGGEIFVRDDLEEILRLIKKKGFGVRIFTNATMINDRWLTVFDVIKPELFEISLYGSNSDIHDTITALPGSFEKTTKNICELVKRGHDVKIKNVWMRENYKDFFNWIDYSYKIAGKDPSWTFTISPSDNGLYKHLRHILSYEQMKELKTNEAEFYKKKSVDFSKERDKQLCDISIPSIHCSAGFYGVCISPFGDVYPCVQIRLSGGNIREKNFINIWRESNVMKFIRKMKNIPIDECSKCRYIDYCMRCPGTAWLEEGSLTIPSSQACREAKIGRLVYE